MSKQPDLSEFYKLSRPKKQPCQIGFVLGQLSEAEASQLQAALATDSGIITAGAVVGWLKARGHNTNPVRVTNHRKGTCTCDDA